MTGLKTEPKTAQGLRAESAAAQWLQAHGYVVVARNWRTPLCEIDIIVRSGYRLFFVEVKYRHSEEQGDGFSYITRAKLIRMRRAARHWLSQNPWYGEYCLSAASVTGPKYDVKFIDSIEL